MKYNVSECLNSVLHFLQAILDHHFEENLHISPSLRTVISDTAPVLIPGSPVKRSSPSQQSSHENMEVVDKVLDDEGPDSEGIVLLVSFLQFGD